MTQDACSVPIGGRSSKYRIAPRRLVARAADFNQAEKGHSPTVTPRAFLANFQIQGDRALLPFSHLKLHRVALVQIFDLTARREAAAVKEDVFAAIVRLDEAKAFLPHNFFYSSGHKYHFSCKSAVPWIFLVVSMAAALRGVPIFI